MKKNMLNKEKIYRNEYKYLINNIQMKILCNRIKNLFHLDKNIRYSAYNVKSLYFDNYHNDAFYDNENSINPRKKYRIRIYNNNPSIINLELKHKIIFKTLKEKCSLNIELAKKLISGSYPKKEERTNKLLLDITEKILVEKLKPVIITIYDRIPYVYNYGNIRVTFDTNFSSSNYISDFFNNNIAKRPVLPTGMILMEIKFDNYMPDIVYNVLQLGELDRVTFSKFYFARNYNL